MSNNNNNNNNERSTLLNKTILITGGNSGIGLEACKILCKKGHVVIATVRSPEKGDYCLQQVRSVMPKADIHYMICDVSNTESIRYFVDQFKKEWLQNGYCLDVLVNNAGISPPEDGRHVCPSNPEWEISVATNCLGPLYLADLLTDALKEAGQARLVMLSSSIILFDTFLRYETDLDDLMLKNPKNFINAGQAYKNSKVFHDQNVNPPLAKVALMLATLALNEELKESKIKVTSVCPGQVPGTNIDRYSTACTKCCLGCFLAYCCYCCVRPQSLSQGGNHIVDAAIGKKGDEGNGLFYARGLLKQPPPQCRDTEKQRRMLQLARELTHLKNDIHNDHN